MTACLNRYQTCGPTEIDGDQRPITRMRLPYRDAKRSERVAKTLLSCEGQNQSDEHKVVFNNDPNRFAKIAEDLGLDVAFVESLTPPSIAAQGYSE